MYCSKCGKKLDDNHIGTICNNCCSQNDSNNLNGYRRYGFGKSLTSCILSAVGLFLSIIAYVFCILAIVESTMGDTDIATVFGILLIFSAVGISIPGLVMGISGIRLFVECNRKYKVKPVATLVLGIAGVSIFPATIIMTMINCIFFILAATI